MRIKVSKINKFIHYILFMAAFFCQSYVDGKYIAYGEEPFLLKILKYLLVGSAILLGFLQIRNSHQYVFLKELRNVLISIGAFFLVSLVLILFRGGDLGFCLELLMRYAMSVAYSFVLLNIFDFEDIYNLMVYFLFVSIFGWILQIGDIILDAAQYLQISFQNSYSPFESHYFAPSAMNCCAFFVYYRKNRWTQIVSFLFALMTFKRVQLVFAIALLILPILLNPNHQLKKGTVIFFALGIIVLTLGYYVALQPEYEWIIEGLTGQTAEKFTSGRSTLLRTVLNSDYKMGGLGTTEAILGRGIEMDLISIMLEMSLPVMALFVFCYVSVAGQKVYAMLVMAYLMVLMMTGSGLYNVFLWTTAFLFFGSVNYLKTKEFHAVRRWKQIRFKW